MFSPPSVQAPAEEKLLCHCYVRALAMLPRPVRPWALVLGMCLPLLLPVTGIRVPTSAAGPRAPAPAIAGLSKDAFPSAAETPRLASTRGSTMMPLPSRTKRRSPLPPQDTRVAAVCDAPPDGAIDTAELYTHAKRLLQLHRYGEAAEVLTRLTRLTPDDGRVWIKLMTIHKRARRLKNADATIRDGIKACPENARLRQALADLCRERRQFAEARTHFKKAMELEPTLASVYDSWGRMEAHLGKHAVAASLYERGLELQTTARLCHALGVLLDTQGQPERARETLRRGLSLPNEMANPQLLHALGMLEVRARNLGAARGHFLSAIKEHPSFTKAYLSLGQLEERLGNRQAARRHYEAGATAKQPNGALGAVQLWQSWARMEQRLGRDRYALSLFKRAHARFPEDSQLLVEWAKLAGEQPDSSSQALARDLFSQVTDGKKPTLSSPYAFQCAAALEVRTEQPDAARALFERGAALPAAEGKAKEQRVPLLHAWAVFEWRQGDPRQARKLFVAAEEEAAGECGWLFQWRASFEADVGNMLVARHYYARAVNKSPLDTSAWGMWAELEAQLGNSERAETLSRHSQVMATQALLQNSLPGTRRTTHPLAPADLYHK